MSQMRLNKDIGVRARFSLKNLGQTRPGDTNAVSLYSPPSNVLFTEVTRLVVCNTTANAPTFRIFIDDDGTTYDQTTALYYDCAMTANETKVIDLDAHMTNSSGNLAVRSSAASEITFTLYGVEVTK